MELNNIHQIAENIYFLTPVKISQKFSRAQVEGMLEIVKEENDEARARKDHPLTDVTNRLHQKLLNAKLWYK